MVSYVAYNRLYYLGKPKGKKFIATRGATPEEARKRAMNFNRQWNKTKQKEGYTTRVVEVKRVGVKRKPARDSGLSLFGKGGFSW